MRKFRQTGIDGREGTEGARRCRSGRGACRHGAGRSRVQLNHQVVLLIVSHWKKERKKLISNWNRKIRDTITIDDEAGRCGVAAQLVVGHAGVLAFVFGVDAPDGEPCHALLALDLRRKVFAQPQQLFQWKFENQILLSSRKMAGKFEITLPPLCQRTPSGWPLKWHSNVTASPSQQRKCLSGWTTVGAVCTRLPKKRKLANCHDISAKHATISINKLSLLFENKNKLPDCRRMSSSFQPSLSWSKQ